jgi:hypothetical protein
MRRLSCAVAAAGLVLAVCLPVVRAEWGTTDREAKQT